MDLTGITGLTLGVLPGDVGATVEVRVGSPTGPKLGQARVGAADAAGQVVSPSIDIDGQSGTTTLYLVSSDTGQPAGTADADVAPALDWLVFHGRGVADATAPRVEAAADRTGAPDRLVAELSGSAVAPEGREITSYRWDLGDGTTAEGQEVTHEYSAPGRYTARLVATDSAGARDWATVELVVADTGR